MKCVKCNADIAGGAKFCSSCGSPVDMCLSCSKCGHELNSGCRFCPECGTAVVGSYAAAKMPEMNESANHPSEGGAVVKRILAFVENAYNNTACVLTESQITSEMIAKSEAEFSRDEPPIVLLKTWSEKMDKITGGLASAMGKIKLGGVADFFHKMKPGTLAITKKRIRYIHLYKDSYAMNFIGANMASVSGEILLEDVRRIEFGEGVYGYGPSYVGNKLIINGTVVGLLRVSAGGQVLDEESIDYLTKMFDYCFNSKQRS